MKVFDSFRLDGQVAMITGGSRDLGYDMAEALAEAGCHLAITSRNLDRATDAAKALGRDFNVDVLPLSLDVADFEDVSSAVDRIIEWKGRIDILINNAGGGGGGVPVATDLFERPVEAIESLITVNLLGTIFCCKAVGPKMVEAGRGKIINIGSIAGVGGREINKKTVGRIVRKAEEVLSSGAPLQEPFWVDLNPDILP